MPPTLTHQDIINEASHHGINAAALRAVILTESAGGGFLPDGRVKILYERHWMWRRLQTRPIDPSSLAAAHPELCGQRWDPRAYPYGSETHQYERIDAVLAWASAHAAPQFESYKKSAYEACSWGMGQIMGLHYADLGFADIYPFKHFMEASEANQLEVMIRFLNHNGLAAPLSRLDWKKFAGGYNGNGAIVEYSGLLARNYRRAQAEGY